MSSDSCIAIRDAFTQIALRGLSIAAAFDESPISRSWYYELRQLYPDEVAALEEEGRQAAIALRERRREEFSASREDAGISVAISASDALKQAIPVLAQIARGEHFETEDSRGRRKVLFSYPRDIAQAAALLHSLSKEGVWREDEELPGSAAERGAEAPPNFVGLDWETASVKLADGTLLTAERGDVIEGEAEIIEE